jgi:hypothetical protein
MELTELAKKAFDALLDALEMSDQVPRSTIPFEPVPFDEENLARFTEPELKGLIDAAGYYSGSAAELEVAYRRFSGVYDAMAKRLSKADGEE